jgi:hypothetical protein
LATKPHDAPASRQEAPGRTPRPLSDTDALEAARLITGKPREIQGMLYVEDATDAHERIDALLLSLLEQDYPELVSYVRRLKVWYG